MYDWRASDDTPRVSKRLSGLRDASSEKRRHAFAAGSVAACPGALVRWKEQAYGIARRAKGPTTLNIAATALAFFGSAVVAAVTGACIGVAMIGLTRAGTRLVTPEAPEIGMARAVVLMLAGLAMALAGLVVYFAFMRHSLAAFGLGMVAGFIVPATVALFRLPASHRAPIKGR